MEQLVIKKPELCEFDILSLGEIMVRFDPNSHRIRFSKNFDVYEGGAEYNVARGLRSCFKKRSAIVTCLADNELGRLIENLVHFGGVNSSLIKWYPYDGIGKSCRNGLNFTERGFGIRGALSFSDRSNTAISKLKPGQINWDEIFGKRGVRWFHTGGVFAALSEAAPEVINEALIFAKKYGTITSFDLNYRESLWKSFGGISKCQEINRKLVESCDVIFGNEEDFKKCLGLEVKGADENLNNLPKEGYKSMLTEAKKQFSNLKLIASTLRNVKTASINDWSALCLYQNKLYESQKMNNLAILDRVGGGDSFASGLIYGFLESFDPLKSLNYGLAHGALAMTIPGDTSFVQIDEVKNLVEGGSARIRR